MIEGWYIEHWRWSLIKWDNQGNQLWNRSWGIKGLTIGNGIWGDGNYVYTVGYTSPDYYYNEDSYLCLIKWDSNGNQIWNRTMGDQIRVENGIWGYGTNVYIVGQENASLLLMDWDEKWDFALE